MERKIGGHKTVEMTPFFLLLYFQKIKKIVLKFEKTKSIVQSLVQSV